MDAPQVRHAMRETVNAGLVGIISGSMDATDLGKATELAIGLGTEGSRLRPLLIIGRGALLNVTDIVFARGVDVGIVQSDVLAALKRDPPFPGSRTISNTSPSSTMRRSISLQERKSTRLRTWHQRRLISGCRTAELI
jgi:hypothetical protein